MEDQTTGRDARSTAARGEALKGFDFGMSVCCCEPPVKLRSAMRAVALTTLLALSAAVPAPRALARGATLGDDDRQQIEQLIANYARALSSCTPEAWADLYESSGGYFGSGSRGHVTGRARLAALVRSEPACVQPTPSRNGSRQPPKANIQIDASPDGAVGRILLGGGAYYQDAYVKTSGGWRFRSRNVLSAQEAAAHLTVEDFIQIRALAGEQSGTFDDVYTDDASAPHSSATPGGGPGRLFRASGLVVTLSPEGVRGKAYLRGENGFYDDLYVKTSAGWRFASRQFVPNSK